MPFGQKIALVIVVAVAMSVVLAYVCIYLLYGAARLVVWWKARKNL